MLSVVSFVGVLYSKVVVSSSRSVQEVVVAGVQVCNVKVKCVVSVVLKVVVSQ